MSFAAGWSSGRGASAAWWPGLPPDTLGFALRTVAAVLIALYAAFWLELDSAGSAAVTVGILAQPSRGMILSKAANRLGGTLIGAVAAVALVAAFGQDRTMLLAAFALWLGLCTAVATLLRDFRAYGAVLAGYTAGIIALSDLTAPQDVFTSAVARVAVIALGIVSIGLVSAIFAPRGAYEDLVETIRASLDQARRVAMDALGGGGIAADVAACVALGGTLIELRTPIDHAAVELQDGADRATGARGAVSALLAVVSASRAVVRDRDALRTPRGQEAVAAAREGLRADATEAARRASADRLAAMARDGPISPAEAILFDRLQEQLLQIGLAWDGIRVLEEGGRPARDLRLPLHLDWFAAGLNAARTILAVAAAELFVVLAGWPGASFVLVQIAALCALVSLRPNPTQASIAMLLGFPIAIVVAAVCEFAVLPGVSGFPALALALAMAVPLFLAAIAVKVPRTNAYGANFLTFFPVMLTPANLQSYNPVIFANTALQLLLSGVMAVVGFYLILPVSPRRRLFRVVDAVTRDLARAARDGEQPPVHAAGAPLRPDAPGAELARPAHTRAAQAAGSAPVAERTHGGADARLAGLGRRGRRGDGGGPPGARLPGAERGAAGGGPGAARTYAAPGRGAARRLRARPGSRADRGGAADPAQVQHSGGERMWQEVSLSGVLISPFVVYALAAFAILLLIRPLLSWAGFQRWTWNTPLAEAALYVCILGLLVAFL